MRRQFLVLNKGFFQVCFVLAILSSLVVVPSKACNAAKFDVSTLDIEFILLGGDVGNAGPGDSYPIFFDDTTPFQFTTGREAEFSSPDMLKIIQGTIDTEMANRNLVGQIDMFNGQTYAGTAIEGFDLKMSGSTTDEATVGGVQYVEILRTANDLPDSRDKWIFYDAGFADLDPDPDNWVQIFDFHVGEDQTPIQPSDLYARFVQNPAPSPIDGFAMIDTGPDWSMKFVSITPSAGSNIEVVPEPTTIALLGIGLVGLAGCAARQRLKKDE